MSLFNALRSRLFGETETGKADAARAGASAQDANAPALARDTDVEGIIAEGLEHHQVGDLQSAERAYRQALNSAPHHADVHYLLGSLLGVSGELEEALQHLREAVRLDADGVAARSDMGNVYRVQGRLKDAESAYRDAIAIDADFLDAYRNLGDLLNAQGRVDEAIQCFTKAAALSSENADAHFILADLLSARGRYQEACRSYRAGLDIAPQVAAAHNNLGASLRHLGRNQEALACFGQALRLDPQLADAHINLAELLQADGSVEKAIEHYRAAAELPGGGAHCQRSLGKLLLSENRIDEALTCFRQALTLDPESAHSHYELGNALAAAGHVDEAIERFRQAVRLDPEDASAQVNLGFALNNAKRFEEAKTCFLQALALNPELVEAHNNLGGVLQMQGELRPAMQAYQRALDLAPNEFYVRSNYLTCLNYHDEAVPEDVFDEHRRWSELLAADSRSAQTARISDPDPERRLRIGYVSADLRYHSVAFFIAPILEQHDRERFEITCYANVASPDANTERLKALSDHWRDIAQVSDAEVAAWIRRDAIDILVDLSGHTVGNRLPVFAQRAAPIQVTYLGYPNTTGLQSMDYRLSDALTDPPGRSDRLHSEELVRLSDGFLCFQPLESCPEVREPRSSDGAQGITFASFNELLKVTPPTVSAWCEILERTPGSTLIIKGTTLEDEGTRNLVAEKFIAHGLDPDRLRLIGRTSTLEEHLGLYNQVDIALDTYPYNGTTTTCEALWMGVPVVSQSGEVHASRVGLGLLSNVGLDELVANDSASYVEAAVKLAADHQRRAQMRKELRDRMRASALMDAQTTTRSIESAYRRMWQRACEERASEPRAEITGGMTVNVKGGVRVHVPAGIEELTPYVLMEQEDWFEDEIRFVRHLLQPGMRCLDIGANYGIFSLNCARQVGPQGSVWSFEPTPETARYLSMSIKENGFENIRLMPMALSRACGTAKLVIHADSEHNYLSDSVAGAERFEIVDVRSLDELTEEQELTRIDFVKVDAEGAEIAILEGGARFFERESPIILFEFKYREGANWQLIDALQARGYGIYRLVAGLQVLAPFEREHVDAFQLNLFAIKADRAESLETQALLIRSIPARATAPSHVDTDLCAALGRRPYAASLAKRWRERMSGGRAELAPALLDGLTLYCRAWDASLGMAERFAALRQAHERLSEQFSDTQVSDAETARLYCLARVAAELGFREQAVAALNAICVRVDAGTHTPGDAPFLAVSDRFDAIEPGDVFEQWCLASVLEQRERLAAFSSYFQDEQVLGPLDVLEQLPFQSAEMARRRQLVRMRLGQQDAPSPSAPLARAGDDNLNPGFWAPAHAQGPAD
jgi:FkbM family methyltransferase